MTSGPPIWLVTGEKGSGKTQALQHLIERLKNSQPNLAIDGLLSPAVLEAGTKIGIDLLTIADNRRKRLAHRREFGADGPTTQRWAFQASTIAWANQRLRAMSAVDLLILDELGPLELERGLGFQQALPLLASGNFQLALVVIRPSLLDVARRRWHISGTFDVAEYDNDESAGAALESLVNMAIHKETSVDTKKDTQMKMLAFATDDGDSISQHFGMAQQFVVVKIENGAITGRESRPKFSAHTASGDDRHNALTPEQRHARMVEPIMDCQMVIAGGMGMGALNHFKQAGIEVLLTDASTIDAACQAYINDELKHIAERLHQGHRH